MLLCYQGAVLRMFRKLLGFKTIQRRVEDKIIQLSFIPSKYFEALYVECNTKIHNISLDILEIEEKSIRGELLKLMKEGEVDTTWCFIIALIPGINSIISLIGFFGFLMRNRN